MPFEARQRDQDVGRDVVLLEQPQHAVAHVRRIVVGDDRLARALGQRDFLAATPAGATGCTSITSSS